MPPPQVPRDDYPVPAGYTLLHKIGEGAFGRVFKALGPDNCHYALKFVLLDGRAGEREVRSLELMREIEHPRLIRLFHAWEREGYLTLVMELADQTLDERRLEVIRDGGKGIPLRELLEYMGEAADGLDYLNFEKGIQHRDVKPKNLLLKDGAVRVADFGIAKILEHTQTSHSGAFTPLYAAPECFDEQSTRWSDQYSLAVTYCRLRGDRYPFEGSNLQLLKAHGSDQKPDLAMLPPEERHPVEQALSRDPPLRWPTCRAFVNALTLAALPARSSRRRVLREDWCAPTGGNQVMRILEKQSVWIPPGEFLMGSRAGKPGPEVEAITDEKQHRVAISKGFSLCRSQVTRGLYAQFVHATRYVTDAERRGGAHGWDGAEWKPSVSRTWRTPGFDQAEDHPVVCISWEDAVAFCEWLTGLDREGRRYRLPTEAEWEYACRAGTTTIYPWGDRIEDGQGWCNIADLTTRSIHPSFETVNWESGYTHTSPVGVFRANAWGLFDMIGNVWEWCGDWFGVYPEEDTTDYEGPQWGLMRVVRGSSWVGLPKTCRAAFRGKYDPHYGASNLGFRVAISLNS